MTADVTYRVVLRCDEWGCREKFQGRAHWSCVRGLAADQGWFYHHVRGDLCPKHARPPAADHGSEASS